MTIDNEARKQIDALNKRVVELEKIIDVKHEHVWRSCGVCYHHMICQVCGEEEVKFMPAEDYEEYKRRNESTCTQQ